MADAALTKKMIDGVGLVESTAEGFAVIDSLAKKAADLQTQLDAAAGASSAAATAHSEALAAKDTEIADLTAKVGDTAALDALVAARAQLITDARRVAGDDKLVVDGLSDLEIKKAAVTARQGEDKVKDKADSFFVGAFDYLVDQEPADTTGARDNQTPAGGLRDALKPEPKTPANDAKNSYEDRMAARWAKKKGAA